MTAFYRWLGVVLALHALLLLIPVGKKVASPVKAPLKVGLVFDVGGRGDKSFNDSAFAGLDKATKEFGIESHYLEPGEGSDREAALRLLASQNMDLIIGVGFIFTDDLKALSKEYTQTKFAGVDYVVESDEKGNEILPPPNLAALKFREDEGSFLVGTLAALSSKTGKVGFIGGMDIPLIHRFERGFKAGVKAANPQMQIVSNYAGVTGAAFKDPAKGKELATAQYGQGVDIIYHASGSTGLGIFEAARLFNHKAIGVDSDQYSEAPGFILSSMVKRVDVAVYTIIKECLEKRFQGGVRIFGLKEGGVDYVYDNNNKDLIPDEIHTKVEAYRHQIVEGGIKL